jgi:hypothetical protein
VAVPAVNASTHDDRPRATSIDRTSQVTSIHPSAGVWTSTTQVGVDATGTAP